MMWYTIGVPKDTECRKRHGKDNMNDKRRKQLKEIKNVLIAVRAQLTMIYNDEDISNGNMIDGSSMQEASDEALDNIDNASDSVEEAIGNIGDAIDSLVDASGGRI